MPDTKNTPGTKNSSDGKSGKQASREDFVRLVEPRTSGVLDRLDTLAKLARPRDYAFTPADIDAIETAILGKVNEVMTAFRNPSAAAHKPTFTLGGAKQATATPAS